MAEIRPATAADLDAMVALAESMHMESPRFRGFRFLPARLRATLESLLDKPHGCLLVVEQNGEIVGAFAGLVVPHFSLDVLQACDLGLFMAPQHRGGTAAVRLVNAYLKWAKDIGAEASIGINTGVQPHRTERLLASMGAEQTGTTWTWRT